MSLLKQVEGNEKWIGIGIGAIIVLASLYAFLGPDTREGTWRYGACKVFLELSTTFPRTLSIIAVSENRNGAKIVYNQKNPYGHTQTQLMECTFRQEGNQVSLSRVTIDRRAFHDEVLIADFNRSLPSVLANLPDLTYPKRPPSKLEDLKP